MEKGNILPTNFNSWAQFYRQHIKQALSKYPDAQLFKYTYHNDGKLVELEMTLQQVKAQLFDELMQRLHVMAWDDRVKNNMRMYPEETVEQLYSVMFDFAILPD